MTKAGPLLISNNLIKIPKKKDQTICKKSHTSITIELGQQEQTCFRQEHSVFFELTDTWEDKAVLKTSCRSQLYIFHWKPVGNSWTLGCISVGSIAHITPTHIACLRTKLSQNHTHWTQSENTLEILWKPSHKNWVENTAVQTMHEWKIITWDSDLRACHSWCHKVAISHFHHYWPKAVFLILNHTTGAHPTQKATRTIIAMIVLFLLFWI